MNYNRLKRKGGGDGRLMWRGVDGEMWRRGSDSRGIKKRQWASSLEQREEGVWHNGVWLWCMVGELNIEGGRGLWLDSCEERELATGGAWTRLLATQLVQAFFTGELEIKREREEVE